MNKDVNDYQKILKHLEDLDVIVMAGLRVRPGTDFFHSLLDGHPEIVQTTGSSLNNYYGFWNTAEHKNSTSQLIDEFIYNIEHIGLFDSRFNIKERWGMLGEQKNEFFEVNISQFKYYLNQFLEICGELNSKSFLLSLHGAYMLCLDVNIYNTKVIFFHAHTVENIVKFKYDFPSIKVILMIRELRDGATSFIENKSKFDPSYYAPSSCIKSFKEYCMIPKLINEYNTSFIALESLHKNPKVTMNNLCSDIGISYLPEIILKSTYHSKLWWGDILSKKDLNGFNSTFGNTNKWSMNFNFIDSLLIEFLFSKEYDTFGYTSKISKLNYNVMYILFPMLVILPMKYEYKIFFQNVNNKVGLRRTLSSFYFYLVRIKFYSKRYYIKIINSINLKRY